MGHWALGNVPPWLPVAYPGFWGINRLSPSETCCPVPLKYNAWQFRRINPVIPHGHAPVDYNNLFFSTLYSCTISDSDFVRLPLQTYTHLHSATSAAVVQSRVMFLVHCIISCLFMRDKRFHALCAPSHQILATPLFIAYTYSAFQSFQIENATAVRMRYV